MIKNIPTPNPTDRLFLLFVDAFEVVLNLDFHPLVLQELPMNLRKALQHRQNGTEYARSLVKCGERVFSRSMMFSGL